MDKMKKILTFIIVVAFALNGAGQGYALRPMARQLSNSNLIRFSMASDFQNSVTEKLSARFKDLGLDFEYGFGESSVLVLVPWLSLENGPDGRSIRIVQDALSNILAEIQIEYSIKGGMVHGYQHPTTKYVNVVRLVLGDGNPKTSSAGAIELLDTKIEGAIAEGRESLYEYEVYDVLRALGINTPEYVIISNRDAPLPELPDGEELVLKIVSSSKHKSDEVLADGTEGVMIIPRDKADVVISKMFDIPGAKGVMAYSFIKSASWPSELTLGFADTVTGRLFSFAHGGRDTDYFNDKAYCDYRFPFSTEELVRKTKIGSNFIFGKFRNRQMQLETQDLIDIINRLVEYKRAYDESGKYDVNILDINPLLNAPDGSLWACDAKLEYREKKPAPAIRSVERLRKLLHPKSIAVIGASTSHPDGLIVPLMDNLIDSRDSGNLEKLYFINRRTGEYRGVGFMQTIPEGEEADVYIIVCSAENAVEPAKELLSQGKRVVIIAADEELKLDEHLKEALRNAPEDALLLGPNTLLGAMGGVYATFVNKKTGGMETSEEGDIALICQSGRVQGSTASNLVQHGAKIAYNFGVGNALDLRPVDFLEYILDNEPDIRVVGIFLEGLRDYHESGRLQRQIRRAREKGVTVTIRKGAVSEEGAIAAASHTASTAGEYKHFKAVFEQSGAIVTSEDDPWVETMYAASWFDKHGRPKNNSFFAVNTGGADCSGILDALSENGRTLTIAEPDDAISKILKNPRLRTHPGNPLDVTAAARTDQYIKLLKHLLNREDLGFIITGYIQWVHSTPQSIGFLEELKALPKDKPIIFANADYSPHAQMIKSELRKSGFLVFENMTTCIQALSAVLHNPEPTSKTSSAGETYHEYDYRTVPFVRRQAIALKYMDEYGYTFASNTDEFNEVMELLGIKIAKSGKVRTLVDVWKDQVNIINNAPEQELVLTSHSVQAEKESAIVLCEYAIQLLEELDNSSLKNLSIDSLLYVYEARSAVTSFIEKYGKDDDVMTSAAELAISAEDAEDRSIELKAAQLPVLDKSAGDVKEKGSDPKTSSAGEMQQVEMVTQGRVSRTASSSRIMKRITRNVTSSHLLRKVFIDFLMIFKARLNPESDKFVVAYGAPGADISCLYFMTDFTKAYFVDKRAVSFRQLRSSIRKWDPTNSETSYFKSKYELGYAQSDNIEDLTPAFCIVQELRAMGVAQEDVAVFNRGELDKDDTSEDEFDQGYLRLKFRFPGDNKYRKIVFIRQDLRTLSNNTLLNNKMKSRVDAYCEKAGLSLAHNYFRYLNTIGNWIKDNGAMILNPYIPEDRYSSGNPEFHLRNQFKNKMYLSRSEQRKLKALLRYMEDPYGLMMYMYSKIKSSAQLSAVIIQLDYSNKAIDSAA